MAGATILRKKPKDFGYTSREADVTDLRDSEGNKLDGDTLVFQPGFAALLDSNQGFPKVRVVCLDPESHGYTRPHHHRFVPDNVRAERARTEQERAALTEAIAAATEVRHKFLAETYGNTKSKTAKAFLAAAQRQAAHRPTALSFYGTYNALVTAVAGVDPSTVNHATSNDRVNRVLIARYVTMREQAFTQAARRGVKDKEAADWLNQLVADGYSLSDTETMLRSALVGELPPHIAPRTTPNDTTKPCKDCGAQVNEWCDEECDTEGDDTDPPADVATYDAHEPHPTDTNTR
ncbi:hypothetical protein [Salinispora arenicola]|uniref:hypothetical protein n=1 Tax=Salinispora arenicola TaxID=168697 RepID=UPI000368098D|nr:hypothetical protein [Salinispora arenicola]